MRYRLFQYPLPAPPGLDDLNAFLGTQRVATVTHHLVSLPGGALLVFVVQTVESGSATSSNALPPKVDYREQLSAEEFPVFSQLREERKKWAEVEGVPVYAVFTNAQLAAMVMERVRTIASLEAIEGIGTARVKKYGERLLEIVAVLPPKSKGCEQT